MTRAALAAAALALALPLAASAAELRKGERVLVAADEVVTDDLYVSGGNVEVRGKVEGDLVVFAGTLLVPGQVTGDLLFAGGNAVLDGAVGGTVRAAGGELTVHGSVGQDLVTAGGSVTLGRTAQVGRDLMSGSGSLQVEGSVGGDVLASAGDLVLGGAVGGHTRLLADEVRLAPGAQLGGDLVYTSSKEARIASGATVAGATERAFREARSPAARFAETVLAYVRSLVGLFVLGLLLLLVLPGLSRQSAGTLVQRPWRSLGVGALVLLATPPVAMLVVLAGALIGGWWIALLILALYGLAIAVSLPVAGLGLGERLLSRTGRRAGAAVTLAVGLSLLLLAGAIPVAGAVVVLAAMLLGLGALVLSALDRAPARARPG